MQNFAIFNLLKPLSREKTEQEKKEKSLPLLKEETSPPPSAVTGEDENQRERPGIIVARDFLLRHEGISAKCKRGKK